MNSDLTLALQLADEADARAGHYFGLKTLLSEMKNDHTIVTQADIETESAIRQLLKSARPDDAVHGEEMSDSGDSPRRWVIDPIDGTANYVRGVPVWASLIGLMVEGQVTVGVVSAPALGRRWWAATGEGAWTGVSQAAKRRLHVSPTSQLGEAFLSYSSLTGWAEIGRSREFLALLGKCGRTRAFGDFYSYMLVAEGAVDIATEPELALHDMAALDVIVREAGGRFSNLNGVDGPVGPGALATNGLLHDSVLALLKLDESA